MVSKLEALQTQIPINQCDESLAIQVQQCLLSGGYLSSQQVDGIIGPLTEKAFAKFKEDSYLQEPQLLGPSTASKLLALYNRPNLAAIVCKYALLKSYYLSQGERQYNIFCIEGIDEDGTLNDNALDEWNARRIVIEILDGIPKIIGNWACTTRPGLQPDLNPPNPEGCAFVAFGQYKAWSVGLHYGSGCRPPYSALVQTGAIDIWRDSDRTGTRKGLFIKGSTGNDINLHHGYGAENVGWNSEGCLTAQDPTGHFDFMDLIKNDKRFIADNSYEYYVAVLPGWELTK